VAQSYLHPTVIIASNTWSKQYNKRRIPTTRRKGSLPLFSPSLSFELEEEDSTMALEFRALPLTFLAHALAIAGAVMVLVWVLYYRGGMAWEAANKNLIFNVSL
jgi:hypothetical protein